MKALKVPPHSVITNYEIGLAVERYGGSIHFPHRDKKYCECRIFHKTGTVQVSGNFKLSQLQPSEICHCFERDGYYDTNIHRIGCYCKPMARLLGVEKMTIGYYTCDKYALYTHQNRTKLDRWNGHIDRTILYSFRTLPQYWIDWNCLILTLELGGK